MTVRVSSYDLSADELKEAFRKIANNERKHGGFLTAFAQAYIAADPSNSAILRDVARELADKYEITHYPGLSPSLKVVQSAKGRCDCD